MSTGDDTDPQDIGSPVDPQDISWPLVERRHSDQWQGAATDRIDQRAPTAESASTGEADAPMWPFRLLALIGALVDGWDQLAWENWQLISALAIATAYGAVAIGWPIPHRNDARGRIRIVIEFALHTALVVITGGWASPIALCLIPTVMVAGFAVGTMFAAQLIGASLFVVTARYLQDIELAEGLQDTAFWAGLLGIVAFTSGLSQRASQEALRQSHAALQRVNRLAEANSLLFALQRVAQSMPASLDLDDVVDTTLKRVQTLVPSDSVSLYLFDETEARFDLFRNVGTTARAQISIDDPPPMIRSAIEAPRTVRLGEIAVSTGLSSTARSGMYAALRARGTIVGLLGVESDQPGTHTQQHNEIVHGLVEPFGIAIDNSRLFRRIRSTTVTEERRRIARDLHDQVGSSLAFLGFEVDRAQELAVQGHPVDEVLADLRGHVTGVIGEIRETLHDLRTDVTDERDLPATLRNHLARVADRGTLRTEARIEAALRPPRQVERELWQIALEAITNVERHAQATSVTASYTVSDDRVVLRISDDGIGLNTGASRADRYGMVGMRERSQGIGATFRADATPGGGTTITVELHSGAVRP